MKHTIFSKSPHVLSIVPVVGQIVRLESNYDHIISSVTSTGYSLVSLNSGIRWSEAGKLTWDSLTANQIERISEVWSTFDAYLKDIK